MKNFQNQIGFTLIELMIVVGIIAIIASIAYPSYTAAVMKSNRSEAKVGLTETAQQLQRCFTAYGRFDDPDGKKRCNVYVKLTTGDSKITTVGSQFYDITLSPAATATTYTLVAKPAKAPQTKDKDCNELSINQAGVKKAKKLDNSDNDKCW